MFCTDLDVLYVLVVNLALRQECSGDTSQLTSDVAISFLSSVW